MFKRPLPDNKVYSERLALELDLIDRKNVAHALVRALKVLELVNDAVPHVTREVKWVVIGMLSSWNQQR